MRYANFLGKTVDINNISFLMEKETCNLLLGLIKALESKDGYTAGHSQRVGDTAYDFASYIEMNDKERLTLKRAGYMHDIGKIGVRDDVLLKNGKLTDEEFAVIRSHSEIGFNILKPSIFYQDILDAVRFHHEKYAGGGYPGMVKGNDIPLFARIISLCDCYDAMNSDRIYRKALSIQKIIDIFAQDEFGQWDIDVKKKFIQFIKFENIFSASPIFEVRDI